MNYIFACGGTGGHINPAIAVAKELKKRHPDSGMLFVGTDDGMESELVPREGFDMAYISVSGFSRAGGLRGFNRNVSRAVKAYRASLQARDIIKSFGADIVVGTGGYVSGPVVFGARMARVRAVVHEQNAFAGVTTRMVARRVDRVFLSFENTLGLEGLSNTVVTGNPIRDSILSADRAAARAALGVDERPLVLSCGGSLGAREVNNAMIAVMARSQKDGAVCHIHATGSIDKERAMALCAEKGLVTDGSRGITVCEYIYNMGECMAASDLVINRAGAITLAELTALGKPAILIPSPNVAENHQFHNAAYLRDGGAALLIEEKDLNADKLYESIIDVACDSRRLAEMSTAARALAHDNAAQKIADEIDALLG